MKRIIAAFLIAVPFLFSSCDSENARKFNDKMVNIQKDAVAKVNEITESSNQNDIIRVRDYINTRLDQLKKIEVVSGGESLKQALVNQIEAVSKSCDIMSKMKADNISEKELDSLNEEFEKNSSKIDKYDNAVIEEQSKFAKAKGFRLE